MVNWQSHWLDIRGNFKYDLIKKGSLFLGALVIAFGGFVVHKLSPIIPDWVPFAVVFVLATVAFFWVSSRLSKPTSPSPASQTSNTAITPSHNVEDFYRTYDNAILQDFENTIRKESSNYPEGTDRERFLIRSFATALAISAFEFIWVFIYRSQIVMLEALNKNPMKIEQLRPFYDEAAAQNPASYESYPFTSWLAFLKSRLLIRENGDLVHITVLGREFLKYLIHTARAANDRSN